MIFKRPLVFDVLLLRMLSPHIDAQAPPAGLPVSMHSTCDRRCCVFAAPAVTPRNRFVAAPAQFPQILEDKFAPQLVWFGVFRGGDACFLESGAAASDPRLGENSVLLPPCCCSSSVTGRSNEASTPAAAGFGAIGCSVVPPVFAELAASSALRNAESYSLNAASTYQPSAFHRRTLSYFCDVFLNPIAHAAQGMAVDHELDRMTAVEEDTSLFGGFLKLIGFNEPAKKGTSGSSKAEKYDDEGKESGGISGFFNSIASSVSNAVASAAAVIAPTVEDDDLKYLDDAEPDLHLEEEDDARNKCFCIPTPPTDQVKYIACAHKLSEYVKVYQDDPEFYQDKNERCDSSAKAHRDFWKCLQRVNQTEPVPFGAAAADVQQRVELDLKWMSSALGFKRYVNRRKVLMNRKRCSLKKGMREGTAKLLLQPPEPDMDLGMLLFTLVRRAVAVAARAAELRAETGKQNYLTAGAQVGMASYVYMMYTQISIVYSDWTGARDYTLLVAFLVKEVFFVTYIVVWLLLRIVIPVAALPIILLVKVATSSSSAYQQQKVRVLAAQCCPRVYLA